MQDMTRRNFLKTVAATAAIAVVPFTYVKKEEITAHVDDFKYAGIKIYSGARPSNINDLEEGNLLCTIGNIPFKPATGGIISSEQASGIATATGIATTYVLTSADSSLKHMGSVGSGPRDEMKLCHPVLTTGATLTLTDIEFGLLT